VAGITDSSDTITISIRIAMSMVIELFGTRSQLFLIFNEVLNSGTKTITGVIVLVPLLLVRFVVILTLILVIELLSVLL
jgi:hypothetical protein